MRPALLLGAALPAYSMKKENNEESIRIIQSRGSSSSTIDVKELNLTIAKRPENSPCLQCCFLTDWNDINIESTTLYTSMPEKNPLLNDYINVVNTHFIFGKNNEFALFYDEEKDETAFFSLVSFSPRGGYPSPDYTIVKIMPGKSEYLYVELANGQKRKITPNGKGERITEEIANFQLVNNLSLSQQMEKVNHVWTPLNEVKNSFFRKFKNKLYLSQIVDEKLYLFSSSKGRIQV